MSGSNTWDAIVVGAGHNGLVAAFYLARSGLKVLVVEALEQVGGACVNEEVIPGFIFQPCAHMIWGLRPEIARDTKLIERGLETRPVQPNSMVFPDGRHLIRSDDERRTFDEIAQFSRRDAESMSRWTAFVQRVARLLRPDLLRPPVPLSDIFARYRGTEEEGLLNTVATTSIGEIVDHFFESEEVCAAVSHAYDVGSLWAPGSGLSFALNAAMSSPSEDGERAPRGYVIGGVGRLTELLADAAKYHGTQIRVNSPVKRIIVENGRARGVELDDGQLFGSRVVVSNADPKRSMLKFLDDGMLESGFRKRVARLRNDYGCLKIVAALSEVPEYYAFRGMDPLELARGSVRICPSREYRELCWDDMRHGRLPKAPILSWSTHSLIDPSLAPAGKYAMSCFIEYAPRELREGTWEEKRGEMAERILSLMDVYSPNFRKALMDFRLFTPWDIEQQRLITGGHIHHLDMIPSQLLGNRPLPELSQYRTPIEGYYLCGVGMHPGGEISGAPGHNAAHVVISDLQQNRTI